MNMYPNRTQRIAKQCFLAVVFCIFSVGLYAQNLTVTGMVTSTDDGLSVPGVSVFIKGTSTGTVTDMDGNYRIKAKPKDILVFSFVGMVTQELTVTGSSLNVKLASETIGLDEVVAIGYGTQKKKEVTGAVAQVKAEVLQRFSTADLATALQGAVAGVSVQASSGEPGAGANIQIRGISSVNGLNSPLYVVDGIPQDGDPRLSSSEIETVDFLKDAASCAIYGTRGAAGVILITTRKGTAGEMKVSANGFYGIQKITSGIELLDFEEYFYTHITQKYHSAEKWTSDNVWTSLENAVDNFTNNTNLVNTIEQDNSKIENYSLNISGGTKDLTYNVVGSFFSQDGSLLNTSYDRFNVRANTSFKKGRWTIRTGLGFRVEEQAYASYNLLYEAYKYKPYQVPLDPSQSTYSEGGQDNDRLQLGNVMAKLKQTDVRNGEQFNGNINLSYRVAKGLNFTTSLGVLYDNNTRVKLNPLFEVYDEEGDLVTNSNTRSKLRNTSDRKHNFTWESGLNYTKKFGANQIKLLAVVSTEEYEYSSFWAEGKDLTSNDVANLDQTTAEPSVGIGTGYNQDKTNKLMGLLGRFQYDYKGRYLFSASVRRDGSSRFSKENQIGIFPSASVGWNVADENFFKGLTKTVNAFKIRGSYGTTGNQSFLDYSNAATISTGYDYPFGDESNPSLSLGSTQSAFANPLVQWETAIQQNIGLDLGLFNNQFTITADFYDTQKEDLLFPRLVPSAAGIGQNQNVILNVGDMSNRGMEFAAGYTKHGKFSWGTNVTYSKNINEVTKMSGSNKISPFANGKAINVSGNADYMTYIVEGYEAGAFWMMKTDGIVNTEEKLAEYQKIDSGAKMGDLIYIDQDGNNVIDDLDRVYCGSGTPEFEIGWSFNCDYKGFDFFMQWFGAFGQEVINGSRLYSFTTFTHKDLLYQWSPDNPNAVIPANRGSSHMNYRGWSDMWIEDGSFVRLRNVTLGYTVPKNTTNRIGISKLRFYVASDNPLTFTKYTGYDPEVGNDGLATRGLDKGNYPISSQYRAGIQLDF